MIGVWIGPGNVSIGSKRFPPGSMVELSDEAYQSFVDRGFADRFSDVCFDSEKDPEEKKRGRGRPRKEKAE